ncbi:MAG: hypothetical protein OEW06_02115 [Gemmatimonadota bacterium]|nr:hypothetical protein [Gemmatimonadota bacterium]MDH4349879.1 hypothetical protein [Gemmatimonadota bacterium]
MSIRRFAIAAALATAAAPAWAQMSVADSAARREAMTRFAFAEGDWEGPAWYQVAQGQRDTLWQTERIRYKLRSQILLIEGLGRRGTRKTQGDTAFNAVAIIDWLPERGYAMRSHTIDGRVGSFPIEMSDSGFVWGFEVPGGRIRYTMKLTPAGEWNERGEFSRDGERWFPTFEMLLRRTGG